MNINVYFYAIQNIDKMESNYLDFDYANRKAEDLLNSKQEIIGLYIKTAIYTGLRVGDILKLDWSFFENDTNRLIEGKTKKPRTITLNPELKKYASKVRKGKIGLVFTSQKGAVYATQSVNTILKGIFVKDIKQGKNVSTHSLRKTFARQLYEQNNQSEHILILLSKMLNHSSIAMTRIYLGITSEEIADVYLSL